MKKHSVLSDWLPIGSARIALMLAVFTVLGAASMVLAEAADNLEKQRRSLGILNRPLVDASAFYMFRSYETGREGYVTLIANYNPLQDPNGQPLLYPLDEDAFYTIHIDNTGDGVEDISFRFRLNLTLNRNQGFGIDGLAVPVPLTPMPGEPAPIPVPIGIIQTFPVGPGTPPGGAPPLPPPRNQRLNFLRTYTVRVIDGPIGQGSVSFLTNSGNGGNRFAMPADYASVRQFPTYEAYLQPFTHSVQIPGCPMEGRVFVGQRQMSHSFNSGEFFSLVGIPDFTGNRAARSSSFADMNVTSLALEVPIDCLTNGNNVIGGWTSVHLPRTRITNDEPTFDEVSTDSNGFVQVFRLGNPFLNEASIGMKDKNLYDATPPSETQSRFGVYFTHPTIPVGLQLVRGILPPRVPRNDFVAFYLNGLPGLNETASGAEFLRLNTSIPPVAAENQQNLGAIYGDDAGFPNGRRPGDDVIDISVRVLEGVLCHMGGFGLCNPADAPSGMNAYTDQAWVDATMFNDTFPYLNTPIPGSTVVLNPQTAELISEPARIFTARMSGLGVNPPVATAASGTCTLMKANIPPPIPGDLNVANIVGSCSFNVANPGNIVISTGDGAQICSFPIGSLGGEVLDCEISVDAGQLDALYQQKLYASITSTAHPNGEIRGLLR